MHVFVPTHAFEEIEEHLPELLRRTGLREGDARALLKVLGSYVLSIPEELVAARLGEASKAMTLVDPDDAVYVAAALAIPCDGIWSDDPHLKRQDLAPCWTTSELVRQLRQSGFKV